MSILVYAESQNNAFKKTTFETVNYGKKIAQSMGTECIALTIGSADGSALGTYGADKVLAVKGDHVTDFDSQVYASVIAEVANNQNAEVVIVPHSAEGKALLGRLSIKLDAGSVSGVNALPELTEGFQVRKSVFSGKAYAMYEISSDKKVLSLMGNSFPVEEMGSPVTPEEISLDIQPGRVKTISLEVVEGEVPLPEAERVVSAGRGMKGPENWGIIEELADVLNATTACSRPVADSGWRPHHEHVGQTGVAIKPNLYVAIGISGAIQHLAGVNNSKTIVVINKDPDAPFFKAADYGVVGDLFDVVPRLIESVKKFKNAG